MIQELRIQHRNREIYDEIKKNWDAVAKPIDGMGMFEHFISQIGAIQHTLYPKMKNAAILVYGADNGIVEEGISQSDQSVTAICTENIARGKTSVCVMAEANDILVKVYDMGVNHVFSECGIGNCKIRMGSRNFLKEPAMTEEEMELALETGRKLAKQYKDNGYDLIGIGEIGIGNTTTSSAVCAALLQLAAKETTGRGAGLDDRRLCHKTEVIQKAIDHYQLYEKPALTVLQYVGGYDIAAMVGTILGAAECELPLVLDGFISMVAALVAERVCPGVKEYLVPSHMSKEPAARMIAEELNLEPVIDAKMALGEGTGAVLMISILRTSYEVYKNTCQFEQTGIAQYERFQEK